MSRAPTQCTSTSARHPDLRVVGGSCSERAATSHVPSCYPCEAWPSLFDSEYVDEQPDPADNVGRHAPSTVAPGASAPGKNLRTPAPHRVLDRAAAAGLIVANTLRFGTTDVLPLEPEAWVLRHYSHELARAALDPTSRVQHPVVSTPVPLGSVAFRVIDAPHLVHHIRLGTAVLQLGSAIEAGRLPWRHTTAARFAPNLATARVIAPGSRDLLAERLSEIAGRSPLLVALDVGACYPSIRHEILRAHLLRLPGAKHATVATVMRELGSLGVWGLPVGGVVSRLLAEVALDPVDRAILRQGPEFVRHMDEFFVAARSESDARRVVALVGQALQGVGLTINRMKTKLLASSNLPLGRPEVGPELFHRLVESGNADRIVAGTGLRTIRDVCRQWSPGRVDTEVQWLMRHYDDLWVVAPRVLLTIEHLMPALSVGRRRQVVDWVRSELKRGMVAAIHRLTAVRFLARHGDRTAIDAILRGAINDESPIVRRDSMVALARLNQGEAFKTLLDIQPRTWADRSGLITGSAVLGLARGKRLIRGEFDRLLWTASCGHDPGALRV